MTQTHPISWPRMAAGYVAIAATLPYLLLKISWLAGGSTGFTANTPAADPAFYALNAVTFAMDAVAVGVALTLTHRWGARLPAPLVLFPMWVGTGFLAPIAAGIPVLAVATWLTGGTLFGDDGLVQPWVTTMVYGGFTVQGIALLLAFVLYARRRWSAVFELRLGRLRSGPTADLQRLLGRAVASMTTGLGLLMLYWALGGTAGQPAAALAQRSFTGQFMDGLFGTLILLGGAGLAMMGTRRPAGRSWWQPVVLAWTGAAAMFSWGLWRTANAVIATPLGNGADPGILGLTDLLQVLLGTVMGLVAAFHLAEQHRPADIAQDTSDRVGAWRGSVASA